MNAFICTAFAIAVLLLAASLALRTRRYLWYLRRWPAAADPEVLDRRELRSGSHTFLTYWLAPLRHFHRRERPLWALGYCCYHLAIVTLGCCYGMAALLCIRRGGVPDVPTFLRTVIGFAEPANARHLFGTAAGWVTAVTWGDVLLAATGNTLLWFRGRLSPQKLLVRGLITTIIWSEILGRLHPGSPLLDLHILCVAALATLLPWLYIDHVAFLPFVLAAGFHKRRRGLYG